MMICPHDMSTRTKSSIEYSNNLCSQEISEEVSSDSFCWTHLFFYSLIIDSFIYLFLFQWKELARKYHLIHFAETNLYLFIYFFYLAIYFAETYSHAHISGSDWLIEMIEVSLDKYTLLSTCIRTELFPFPWASIYLYRSIDYTVSIGHVHSKRNRYMICTCDPVDSIKHGTFADS